MSVTTPLAPFSISRRFEAPVSLVWAAWTESDRLTQWFGPKGFGCEILDLDLRPGGRCLYALRTPDGVEMYGRWLYEAVDAPHRIALEMSFSDPEGGVTHHPFAPDWPLRMRSVSTFAEEEGGTRLTIEWARVDPNEVEAKTFDDGREGMVQGWSGTFEGLDAYLERAK